VKHSPTLGLGTVQLGLDYGVTNREGLPDAGAARRIVETALAAGIVTFDTAHRYGESEHRLGEFLPERPEIRIITKTPTFDEIPRQDQAAALRVAFQASLAALRRRHVYALLAHSGDDLLTPSGPALYREMRRLRDDGVVRKIGASVYDADELDTLLDRYPLDLVQIPVSVLDQRFVQSGTIRKLAAAGVEIHARSIFLQGIVLSDPSRLPDFFTAELRGKLGSFHQRMNQARASALQGALQFVRGIGELDCIVIGATSSAELQQIVEAFAQPAAIAADFQEFACDSRMMIMPKEWPKGLRL